MLAYLGIFIHWHYYAMTLCPLQHRYLLAVLSFDKPVEFSLLFILVTSPSLLCAGWKRNWGEKSDILSWSWVICGARDQLLWCFSCLQKWKRGWLESFLHQSGADKKNQYLCMARFKVVNLLVILFQAKSLYAHQMYNSVSEQYNVLKEAVNGKQGSSASTSTISLSQPWTSWHRWLFNFFY